MSPAVLGVVVAIIAAAGSFLGVAWRLSGRVTTSAAGQLWAENTKIKEDYRREIGEDRAEIAALRDRLVALEKRNEEVRRENGTLQDTIDQHERTITTLRTEVDHLRAENATLKERVAAMENGK